jgi:hypothetical protein
MMFGIILAAAGIGIWVVLAFLIFGAASMVFAQLRESQRRKSIALIAESLGIGPPEGTNPVAMLQHLPLFQRGRDRTSSNELTAEVPPTTMTIFDWSFTEGSGKQQSTTTQTVVGLTDLTMNLPAFTIQPETLVNRVQSFLGYRDINFDTHPEFSNTRWLTAQDEAAVRNLFGKRLLDHFAAMDNLFIEAGHHSFILFRPGARQSPEQFRDLMGLAYKTYELLREQSPQTAEGADQAAASHLAEDVIDADQQSQE